MSKAYIGLGSNVGDRKAHLADAFAALRKSKHIKLIKHSKLYETEPLGPPQPDFLNAAAEIETDFSPLALLRELHRIENELGRVRKERWGPRVIDLDILLYEDSIMDTEQLSIPHLLMHEREFVLVPLAEIAPHAVHPTTGLTVGQLLQGLRDGIEE